MALVVSEAIVLHAFDYLESSRIVRLVTRDAGMRSGLAKGARKSRRRFGSGLDLFAQGTAFLHARPGRDLDTLSGFEDVRARPELGADLERFHGAEAIAEIALFFGREGADAELFDAIANAFDALTASPGRDVREATLSGIWQIVATLGVAPTVEECVECGTVIPTPADVIQSEVVVIPTLSEAKGRDLHLVLFSHEAGGVLCTRCAALAVGGRKLPPAARQAIAAWMRGETVTGFDDADARAHQRLLREFLSYHLDTNRTLRAYELWERGDWGMNGGTGGGGTAA